MPYKPYLYEVEIEMHPFLAQTDLDLFATGAVLIMHLYLAYYCCYQYLGWQTSSSWAFYLDQL